MEHYFWDNVDIQRQFPAQVFLGTFSLCEAAVCGVWFVDQFN